MSDKRKPIAGGCMCGAVRYHAKGPSVLVELCHCRRAVGAPFMARAAFRRGEFAIAAGNPRTCESSPGLQRTFCGRCGTSLTLADVPFPDEIYVSVGSFYDVEEMSPEFCLWRSHRLSWLETSGDLPRFIQFKADGMLEERPGNCRPSD